MIAKEEVNASSYVSFHNGQIFKEGLSFSGYERNKVWVRTASGFSDLSDVSGADLVNDSRGVVASDLDDDGDVDLFVHSIQRERHALLRNDALEAGSDAHFLKVRLRATRSQYEAIGSTVVVHGPAGPVAQVMGRGAGFASCQAPELVFGLGDQPKARVEVLWPHGGREDFGSVSADGTVLLVEGRGEAEALPRRPVQWRDPLPPGLRLEEGDLLPPLRVIDRAGNESVLDVAALSGDRSVLLALWADYCLGCVTELPLLQRKHEAGDLRVIALSVDEPGEADKARARLERMGVTAPAFFRAASGARGEGTPLEELVDMDRLKLPTALVLSAEGRIEAVLQGPLKE